MDKLNTARRLAADAAKALCVGGKKATGAQLLQWIRENRANEVMLVENSWPSFLTKIAAEPNGPIMREPGSYGFLPRQVTVASGGPSLNPLVPVSNQEAQPQPRARVTREEKLYAILVDWLDSEGYHAEDTSASRSGGVWGNPDVIGIREIEVVGGALHFEIASVEAKLSSSDWRRVFFEAVSHKRFADRVYFAIAAPAETPVASDLEDFAELREYGEKYRVGVVVVFFNTETYAKLASGDVDEVKDVTLDDARVEEIWPAIFDAPSPFIRDRFLRQVLGIDSRTRLHEFGRED